MSKVEAYFKKLADELNVGVIDVERAWRITRNELAKKGIAPDDSNYNAELMTQTKKKLMKESSFDKYLEESYRTSETKRKELKKEEDHETWYNVMKTKIGETKAMFVKQFNNPKQANSYAKVCNDKSTTHTFIVKKD